MKYSHCSKMTNVFNMSIFDHKRLLNQNDHWRLIPWNSQSPGQLCAAAPRHDTPSQSPVACACGSKMTTRRQDEGLLANLDDPMWGVGIRYLGTSAGCDWNRDMMKDITNDNGNVWLADWFFSLFFFVAFADVYVFFCEGENKTNQLNVTIHKLPHFRVSSKHVAGSISEGVMCLTLMLCRCLSRFGPKRGS